MYLRVFLLENKIDFSQEHVNILEVEDINLFKKVVKLINIYSRYRNPSGEVILVEKEARLDLSKSLLLCTDFYNIEINTNKMLKLLYSSIENRYNMEFGVENIFENTRNMFNNLNNIICDFDFHFDYKTEISIGDFLKIIGLKFDIESYDNPFDNILCLFDITSQFNLYKVICLVNAKSFLNEEELKELYKFAKYKNINLLLIEHYIDKEIKEYEKKLVIDEDYVEFNYIF